MNKLTGKSAKCKDCKGLGWIKTLQDITLSVSFAIHQEPRSTDQTA
jgi:hypothetical protein